MMMMKKTIHRLGMLLLLAALALPAAANAAAWICDCGCGDPVCINIAGSCYLDNGERDLYLRGDSYYDIANENGTIVHADGITVDNVKKNHSWGYYFELPPQGRHYLNWQARLEVLAIDGPTWAGITMENEAIGLNFAVNRAGKAAFSVVHSNVAADTVERFTLPRDLAVAETPVVLGMDYDVRTATLRLSIDERTVRTIRLPYYGAPAIACVTGLSMQTGNDARTAAGSVTYGDFTLSGGN